MRTRVALLALLLPLTSCSLFRADTAPLIAAEASQSALFDRHSAAFEKMARGVTMDEAQRALILAAIEVDRTAYREIDAAVLEWAAAYGNVDWRAEWKKLFDQLKGRIGGAK